MAMKALFHIIKIVFLIQLCLLPNSVQQEIPQFKEAKRKKRHTFRGRPK